MNIKKYTRFVNEEVTIKGNPAIPGEGGKQEGESDYLKTRLEQELAAKGLSPADLSTGPQPSRREGQFMSNFMNYSQQILSLSRGKEKELTDLATDLISTYFAGIIARYEMRLDLGIMGFGQVNQWMDRQEEAVGLDDIPRMEFNTQPLEDRPQQPNRPAGGPPRGGGGPNQRVTDPRLRSEVHKRKIANLITQGEAKNTSLLINSPESRDGLNRIFGAQGPRVLQLMNDLLTSAYGRDLVSNPKVLADMMLNNPSGIAGAATVDFEEEKIESGASFDFGGDSGEDYENEEGAQEEPEARFFPIIRARAVDFFLLIHEAVKSIFEFISAPGIPEAEEDQRIIFTMTGLSDEPEDWKYGPIIAADLRDFLNDSIEAYEKANKTGDLEEKHGNVRVEIWKWILDRKNMATDDFLALIRGCLNKTQTAKDEMQRIIKKVVKLIVELEDYNREMAEYEQSMREYEEKMREFEESEENYDIDDEEGEMWFGDDEDEEESDYTPSKPTPQAQTGVDYSKMSQKELNDLVNDAIDRGDFELLNKISPFLKEGRSYSRKYGKRRF